MNPETQLLLGLSCRLASASNLDMLVERHFSPPKVSNGASAIGSEPACLFINEQIISVLEDTFIDAGFSQIPSSAALFVVAAGSLKAKYGRQLIEDLQNACSYQLSILAQENCEQAVFQASQWLKQGECEFAVVLACDEIQGQAAAAAILLTKTALAELHGSSPYAELETIEDFPENSPAAIPALDREKRQSARLIEIASKSRLEAGEKHWQEIRGDADGQKKQAAELCYISSLSLELCGESTVLLPLLGFISAALALHLRVLPGSSKQVSKSISTAKNFATLLRARPWIHPSSPLMEATPKRALLILEDKLCLLKEYESDISTVKVRRLKKQSSEIFLFAAETAESLTQQLLSLHELLLSDESDPIPNLAFNNNCRSAGHGSCRLSIVARSKDELLQLIEESLLHLSSHPEQSSFPPANSAQGIYYNGSPAESSGKLVFVLPGLGAAYPYMLEDLCFYFPEVRQVFDFVELLAVRAGDRILPSRAIFPASGMQESNQAMLATMDSAVVTLLLAEWAIFALLKRLGVAADVFLGCSTGEFAALTMSEAIDILSAAETFYKLSTHVSRSISFEQLSNLRSIRISGSYEKSVGALLEEQSNEKIFLGADLSQSCVLVSGDKEAIEKLSGKLRSNSIDFINLPVAIPYHTELVSGIISADDEDIMQLPMGAPRVESWSCSTASQYPDNETGIRQISTQLFEKPIKLRSTIEKLYESGARIFLELGPKGGLIPYISETLAGREHLSIAADLPTRPGIDQLHVMLSYLFCRGIDLKAQALYERRVAEPRRLDLKPESLIYELLQSGYDPMLSGAAPVADEVMLTYLATMQEFQTSMMNTQERLIMAYLQSEELEEANTSEPNDSCIDLPFFPSAQIGYGPESYTLSLCLNTRDYPFLLDHAIGGATSAHEEESRVYLLPLMVTLEILAEAACLLSTEASVLHRISDVRAYKRIRLNEENLHLIVELRKLDEQMIETRLSLRDVDEDDSGLLASAIIEFRDSYPLPPAAASFPQQEWQESKFSPDNLYNENSMFHGPRMQSVIEISDVFKRSIDGIIDCRPSEDWFARFDNKSRLVIDPLLLDNSSQLVLYQMYEHELPVSALLPFHIESIEFFDGYDTLSGRVQASAHLRSMNLRGTEAHIEIRDSEGAVKARINEISSRAIVLPETFKKFTFNPDSFVCRKLEIKSIEESVIAAINKAELPQDETTLDWITDYFLSRSEQAQWRSIGRAESRRRDWLAGRLAAKDAVRYLLKESFNLNLRPADIEISVLSSGAVEVNLHSNKLSWIPQISISHCDSMAVAVAERPAAERRAGIDVESIAERGEGFEKLAFTEFEIASLKSMKDLDLNDGIARLWTAKEAAAKAAGSGFRGDPKNFSMRSKSPESDVILIGSDEQEQSGLYLCTVHSNLHEKYCIAVVKDYSATGKF